MILGLGYSTFDLTGTEEPGKGEVMNPLWAVGIPLVLIILGMVLNSLNVAFDQPPSPAEEDSRKRLAEEKESYRKVFYNQRERAIKRQRHVNQYAWLLLFATIGSFIWFYENTVNQTTAANQLETLQTLATEEGKQTVLSLTLRDGDNVKYLIKADTTVQPVKAETAAREKIPSWEVGDLKTALSRGDHSLPLGISLTMANSH